MDDVHVKLTVRLPGFRCGKGQEVVHRKPVDDSDLRSKPFVFQRQMMPDKPSPAHKSDPFALQRYFHPT